jgi:hypothetical protein
LQGCRKLKEDNNNNINNLRSVESCWVHKCSKKVSGDIKLFITRQQFQFLNYRCPVCFVLHCAGGIH